jgi:hypothetical protein
VVGGKRRKSREGIEAEKGAGKGGRQRNQGREEEGRGSRRGNEDVNSRNVERVEVEKNTVEEKWTDQEKTLPEHKCMS